MCVCVYVCVCVCVHVCVCVCVCVCEREREREREKDLNSLQNTKQGTHKDSEPFYIQWSSLFLQLSS